MALTKQQLVHGNVSWHGHLAQGLRQQASAVPGRHQQERSVLRISHTAIMGETPMTQGLARTNRRGVIFVTALWVVLILGIMTLLFARSMRTELVAAQYRAGSAGVDATMDGAIAYVLGVLDAYTPTNATDLGNTPGDALAILAAPGEAIQVGNTSNGSAPSGYFWIIRSNPDDFQNYYYGITDESSKL